MARKITVTLPEDVWQSVDQALLDFLRFGPGEMDSEYIPDEHLEKARKAIDKAVADAGPNLAAMGSPSRVSN